MSRFDTAARGPSVSLGRRADRHRFVARAALVVEVPTARRQPESQQPAYEAIGVVGAVESLAKHAGLPGAELYAPPNVVALRHGARKRSAAQNFSAIGLLSGPLRPSNLLLRWGIASS